MQFLEHVSRKRPLSIVYHEVYRAEVIDCFHYIVYVDGVILASYRSSLEDLSRLIEGKSATLDMIRVVGELHLDLVVNATLGSRSRLFSEPFEKRGGMGSPSICPQGLWGIRRDAPCFASEKRPRNATKGTVIANTALGYAPAFCCL